MAEAQGPAGPRRRLGAELRRLRRKTGMHLEDVAARLDCSTSKISRLETGKGIPKLPDVRELMRIYGVTADTERDMLLRLVKDSRAQGWWEPYTEGVQPARHVLDSPGRYASLETEAVANRSFTAMVLPGLLQTPAYAQALLSAILPQHRERDIARLVELRMRRQQALYRAARPLALSVVIDEALLRRVVGGPELMAAQLRAIADKADLANVDIRVLPFEVGVHRAHVGQFTILELRKPLGDVVYIESHAGDTYLDSADDVALYEEIFADVAARALSPSETKIILAGYLRRYT
ncbi:helix-turn-helix domain-containing protein [Pseudonocardia hispaniensis]|uniref:Helix-turn-helix domain-containing protein n=1 Tax=Pseudonocardia hispaniensis TaxID=904933 RepID=A0ABW1J1D1_9PSEU